MGNEIDLLVKAERKHLNKYKKYIISNDWTYLKWNGVGKPRQDTDIRKEEFNLHNNIFNTIITRLKSVGKKSEGKHHLKVVKDYVEDIKKLIEVHKQRAEDYTLNSDILEKKKTAESADLRANEIDFHRHLHQETSKIWENFIALNIKTDDLKATDGIEFYDNVKAPLSMLEVLVEVYPQIQKALDKLEIDFTTPPKNEMLINMKDVPKWNTDKHFWEQEKDTLQFYVDEFKKIKNGINIDGVYISGWAYYHINVFVTPIPHKIWNPLKNDYDSVDKIINPPLRDSDWMLFENRALQEKTKTLFMFVAATRRAAKTTAEASMLGHAATIGKRELLCAGANAKDLGQLAKNFKTDTLYKNPAFAIYNVANDWSKKVEIGIKTKNQKTIPLSTLHIINTDDGNNKEIFAGFTPDLVVVDEAMKAKFLEALEGLIPAMQGTDGMIRAFGILSGTGGTEKLSEDGYKVLSDPETYDVLPMQWDILERGIDEEFITWKEDKKNKFGTFIPGQCRVDMPKIKSNLADYLGIKSPTLSRIQINITDWEKSYEIIKERRSKVEKDKIKHQKEVVYCPTKPSEIFMSGAINPFPVEELKKRKRELEETGDIGKKVFLIQEADGRITYELSNKDVAKYPHKGGFVDAPVVLYEDFPTVKPTDYLYVLGMDDYKLEEADTDSVGSVHIYKVNVGEDKWKGRIVASFASRPDPHMKLYRQTFLLQQAFNAIGFMENIDDGYKQYLERKRVADLWLQPSIDFKADMSQPSTNKRKYGWTPTPANIRYLKNLVIQYTKEEFIVKNEKGEDVVITGAQRINDLELIQEMIDYREGNNVDRITSFMSCLGLEFHFFANWKYPKITQKDRDKVESQKSQPQKTVAQKMFGTRKNRRIF